jgi:acyl-CoA thioesterase I
MPIKPVRSVYVGALAILQVAVLSCCNQMEDGNRAETQQNAAFVAAPVMVKGPERLILAFGDSLYAGYGLKRGESMPAQIEVLLRKQGVNATVVNAGVSGDTTAAGRKRLMFTLDKLTRKPDLVMLGLGGNDVLRQIPLSETRANLIAMLDELRRRGVPVLLTGMRAPPNLGPDYAVPFDAMYPELAKKYGASLDPFLLADTIGNRRLMLPDGVHPNAKGVDIIAARVALIVAGEL